jgi:branched-chain amino acid aminotransferase group I
MEEIVYLNGVLVSASVAHISPNDRGFLCGYGLFETMRAYSGKIFRLGQHLDRLFHSAQALGLPVESVNWGEAIYETLRANKLADARLRLTLSGGEMDANLSPTVLITAKEYTPYPPQIYNQGFKAVVSCIRRSSSSPISVLKSISRLDNQLARREAEAAGADEAIFLNEQGVLTEGSTSNIFLVYDGVVFTPNEESGILPGITRRAVLELAQSLGIAAKEGRITLGQLWDADEAFLTNSLIEIMPLSQVDRQSIGLGGMGPITQKLAQAYFDLVRRELDLKLI